MFESAMRRFALIVGGLAILMAVGSAPAGAISGRAVRSLRTALRRGMRQIGGASSAYVVDLSTGQTLFADHPLAGRLPASVQKLYTTSTVLLRFGRQATLTTSVLGRGHKDPQGVWHGTLYLRGGGDPTFGWASFDHSYYGSTAGATVETLVANLVHRTGISGVQGSIVGDESYFDSRRSTAESNFRPDIYMEGELSGLAFDRGFVNSTGTSYQTHPALYGAQAFASALRRAGVSIPRATKIRTASTPVGARPLAILRSPPMSVLLRLTNTPSDNFMAEMLLKGLGASFGGGGTTADGVAVVASELSKRFGLKPRFNDGSGLSRQDSTSARQVVKLLRKMSPHQVFLNSLAIGGETGTLRYEMEGSGLRGRCRGKTGSLQDVANLSGYCQAQDGHTLVFAFLANQITNPDYVHSIEGNHMAEALIRYDG